MRQKRILRRIIIAFCCVITLLPPNMVFAATVVEEAEENGNYGTLARILMWAEAADYCKDRIENSTTTHSTDLHEVNEDEREKIYKFISLDFEYSTYSTMYSSLLEDESDRSGDVFGGGTDDSKVWCSELNGRIFRTLLDFFSYDAARLKQTAVCGVKDSESGEQFLAPLFSIRLQYSGEGWPRNWAEPSVKETPLSAVHYLTTEECNANYENIVSILEPNSDGSYDIVGDDDFKLMLGFNWGNKEKFNAFKWLSDYLGGSEFSDSGDSAVVFGRANRAMQYMTFERICKPNVITEEEYNNSVASNVYKIFNLIGEIKFVKLDADVVEKTIYASLPITTSSGETTCGDLAESFDDSEWASNARYYQIMGCYNQHLQNLEDLRKVKTYLGRILSTAKSLLERAKKEKNTPYFGTLYEVEQINEFIEESGIEDSVVLNELVDETEKLEIARDEFHQWRWHSNQDDGREESEVISEYDRAIERYERYIGVFETDIINEISEKVDAVPDFEGAWGNINVNSIDDDVTGFYHFSDTSFVCVAVQNDLRVEDEINDILGGTIGGISDYIPPTIDFDDDDRPAGETDPCYAGSGGLGWILCPVITAASGVGEFMWNEIESVLLVPVAKVFENNGAVEKAWGIIRNIANIIFVILLLIVIFSQLTGVGIDNYGVKKILPKLIVTAILVNLSYVICKIVVDLSNVIGSGLESMLSGFANNVTVASGASIGWQIGSWLTTIAGVGAGVTIWVLLSEGGIPEVGAAIGLAALGLVISVLVAVTFMYIILGVRMAGVILCIVLSPVAIVCYALPNTEKIYKKWFDLFKALLVVYPICGAMIGAGQFAGAIMASIPNSTMKLMAMLVQAVPFFFVPTLLKGSLSLMGNVGAKLSSVGKSFGRKGAGFAKSTIRGTDAYKRNMKFSQERKALRRANRTMSRLNRRSGGNVENLSRRQQERLRMAQDTAIAYQRREAENERRSGKDYYNSVMAAEEADRVDKETSQRLSLMKSSGANGGIGPERAPYTLQNLERRMNQLRENAETRALNSDEQIELAALARGLSSMSGGGGVLGSMVRGNNRHAAAGANFMRAFAQVYSQDSVVQKKLNEKDAGASVYTEQFMRVGGEESPFNASFSDYSGTSSYRDAVDKRIKSYAAGLDQSGGALTDYINGLSQQDCQNIMDDDALLNSLDRSTRQQFERSIAERWPGMTQTPRTVNLVNVPPVNTDGENSSGTDFDVPHDRNGTGDNDGRNPEYDSSANPRAGTDQNLGGDAGADGVSE